MRQQNSYGQTNRETGPPSSPTYQNNVGQERGGRISLRWRRLGILMGMVLGPVVMLALVALGIGYFRMRQGPIVLPMLAAPIERGIRDNLHGLTPKISDVVMTLNDEHGLEFRLQNLTLLDEKGAVVASAPSAAVELSSLALFAGQIVPSRVELIEPRLFLIYSQEKGLSLSFANEQVSATAAPKLVVPPRLAARPDKSRAKDTSSTSNETGPTDLVRMLARASQEARKKQSRSNHLKQFGLRDATLLLDYEGQKSVWKLPSFSLDVNHGLKNSVLSGGGQIASRRGPWSFTFHIDDHEDTEKMTIKTSIRDLVPEALAPTIPQFLAMQYYDLPVSADVTVSTTRDGELIGGDLAISLSRGQLLFPANNISPLRVDGGLIKMRYLASSGVAEILPTTMLSGGNQLRVAGKFTVPQTEVSTPWPFQLDLIDGWFQDINAQSEPIAVDAWKLSGSIDFNKWLIALDDFKIAFGGGSLSARGAFDIATLQPSVRVHGQFSPMSMKTFKVLWPSILATDARRWVDAHVTDATIKHGKFFYYDGRFFREEQPDQDQNTSRLSLTTEFSDVKFHPVKQMAEVAASRVLLRLENDTLEIAVPEAELHVSDTQRIKLKAGRLSATQLDDATPKANVLFTSSSKLNSLLTLLDQPPLEVFRDENDRPTGLFGDIKGTVNLSFPLLANLKIDEVALEAQLRLRNGHGKDVIGTYDVQGATMNFDITDKGLDAKGSMLIGGIPSDVTWQRNFALPREKQPPISVVATLDNADRKQLGMDIDGLIDGDVPIKLAVQKTKDGGHELKLRADLTKSEMSIAGLGWKKRAGRRLILETDIAEGKNNSTELQNFTLRGDKIAAEGWAALDKDDKPSEFYFPVVSLDVVTQLKVEGKKRRDGIWNIQADGPTVNGRGFFRSLYSLGQNTAERTNTSAEKGRGFDLTAKVNTVIGFSDQTLRGVSLKMSKRGGRLSMLDAKGKLESGKPVAVRFVGGKGKRRQILADSTDAGRVFKLIGFYPNLQGGRVRLEVDLDGRGAAEKTGILWVDRFQVLSDPIVTEVVESGQSSNRKRKRKAVREVFQFDRMKAPFSVGHDQFVLKNAYVNGPLIGATIRGKVDYRARRLNLGGTYIPLQGINNMLGEIPLLGDLLSGPRREGIFGITFAINGAMANPDVIVNPLSLVTPGIFREIFQLTPNNPRVQPRAPRKRAGASRSRARSSSAPATGNSSVQRSQQRNAIDGWSSKTTGNGIR